MVVRISCSCGEVLGADTAQAVPFIVCPKCRREHPVPRTVESGAVRPSRPATVSGGFRDSVWIAPVGGTTAAILLVTLVILWAVAGPNGSLSPAPPETGTGKTVPLGQVPPPAPAAPGPASATPTEAPSPLVEQAARDALETIRKFETDPNIPRSDLISLYEKNLIALYPNTKAAEEARRRIAVLQGAGTPAPKPPPRFPPPGPKPPAPPAGG